MFNNVGEKLKNLAAFFTCVGIVFSVILGIVVIKISVIIGLLVMVAGSLLSWIASLGMYAFGELVDNTSIIAGKKVNTGARTTTLRAASTTSSQEAKRTTFYTSNNNTQTSKVKVCPHCGEMVRSNVCDMCGNKNNLFD